MHAKSRRSAPIDSSPPARPARAPFIGRQPQLDAVLDAAGEAGTGKGSAVLVTGSRGVGKTRFTLEVQSRVTPRLAYASALCERSTGGAGAPLANLMSALAGPDLVAATEACGNVAGGFRRALEALGAQRPLCAVIEDIHLADATTLAVLGTLCEQGPPPGVLLIMTGRPSRGLIGFGRQALDVAVKPLEPEDTHRLLRALAPGLTTRDLAALVGWAPLLGAGNPLYSTFCVRAVEAEAGLVRGEDGLVTLDEALLTQNTPPDSMTEAINRLLDRLGDKSLAPLGAAALRSARFSLEDLELLGADSAGLSAAIGQAVELGVCIRTGAEYMFEHETVRRRLVRRLRRPLRRALHARVAEQLEDSTAAPGITAYHWERAGDRYRAARAHLGARRRAELLGAGRGEARLHGERARRLFVECGRERTMHGRFGAAVPVLERACALAEEMDAQHDLINASALLAISLGFAGEHKRATALCERARELASRAAEPVLTLAALCATSAVAESCFDAELAMRAGADALTVAGQNQLGGEWLCLAAMFAGRGQFRVGHLERARLLLGRALDVADEEDIDMARGWAYAFRGDVNLVDGKLGAAVRDYRLAMEAEGDEFGGPLGLIGLAHTGALRGGAAGEVEAHAQEAVVRLRAARSRSALAQAMQRQAESLELLGHAAQAVETWARRDAVFEELALERADWWPVGFQTSRPRVASSISDEPTVEQERFARLTSRDQTLPGI